MSDGVQEFSDLESHLDVGEHRQERRGSETVYMTNSEEGLNGVNR